LPVKNFKQTKSTAAAISRGTLLKNPVLFGAFF